MDRKVFRNRRSLVLLMLCLTLAVSPVSAQLAKGDAAPDFTTEASFDGKPVTFSLADALKQGPVVLYFYPAAFTKGCTIEAHDFAQAIDRFKGQGATVIGVSHDTIETLNKFSTSECQSKFAVASDADGAIMKSYDAEMTLPLGLASRISYVIAPDRTIVYAYSAMNPDQHVANTLQALEGWRKGQGKSD